MMFQSGDCFRLLGYNCTYFIDKYYRGTAFLRKIILLQEAATSDRFLRLTAKDLTGGQKTLSLSTAGAFAPILRE